MVVVVLIVASSECCANYNLIVVIGMGSADVSAAAYVLVLLTVYCCFKQCCQILISNCSQKYKILFIKSSQTLCIMQ